MRQLCLQSILALAAVWTVAACGPTLEEQRAMDQSQCSGFGFSPGTNAYC